MGVLRIVSRLLLLMAISLGTASAPCLGRKITVSSGAESDYATIGAAMVVAVSGDTVRVAPGTYVESLELKSGVVLQGSGYEHTRIEFDAPANPVFAHGVSEAVLSDFTLAYTGSETVAALAVSSSQVRMSHCRIVGHSGTSVVFVTGESALRVEGCLIEQGGMGILLAGGSQAAIYDSQIRDNQWAGVEFSEGSSGQIVGSTISGNGIHGVTVREAGPVSIQRSVLHHNAQDGILGKSGAEVEIGGNTLVANGSWGIQIVSGSVARVVDNIVVANNHGGITTQRGEEAEGTIAEIGYNDVWNNSDVNYQNVQAPASDLSVAPLFVDPEAADYRLWAESPLAGAASDGGTIGALPVAADADGGSGFQPELPGDFDGDGTVDFADFFLFADAFGSADSGYDLDGNGQVDFADFFLFADAFGRTETGPDVSAPADE